MNICTFTGYVVSEPEMREAAGTPVLNFRFKNSVGYGDKAKAVWMNAAIWGARAEKLSGIVRNGQHLAVSGELTTREYQKDGQTRQALELRIVDLDLGPRQAAEPQRLAAGSARDVPDEIPF